MKLKTKATFLLILTVIFSSLRLNAVEEEREFRMYTAADDLSDNTIQNVVCTRTGRIIISTLGDLNFYDGAMFVHISSTPQNRMPLSMYRGKDRLYFDRYHHLWQKGPNMVSCIDMMMETYASTPDSVIKQLGCNEYVHDLFTDSEKSQLWLLTDKGLYGVDQKQYYTVLRDRNLQEVDVYDNMLVTFYDNGEEVAQDLNSGRVVHRTMAYDWSKAQKYMQRSYLHVEKEKFYLIKTGETGSILLCFDIKIKKWSELLEVPYSMNCVDMYQNSLYIATDNGYWTHNLSDGQQKHVTDLKLFGSSTKINNAQCNVLEFDKQGGMWIGTEHRGLLYARPEAATFQVMHIDDAEAKQYVELMEPLRQNITEFNGMVTHCMFTDSRKWSWFGTSSGLYLYKTPKSKPIIINKSKGLFNNIVHSIVEDQEHNIWLSTSCGITCVMLENDKIVLVNSFNTLDNVPNESFINCKAMCLPDGSIIMQTFDHIVKFHPDDFNMVNKRQPLLFYPKLSKLMVNGKVVHAGDEIDGKVIIDRAVTRAKDIVLEVNQGSVSLVFSGLNYFRPLQTYFRVRIKGQNEEKWDIYSFFYGSDRIDNQGLLHLPLLGLKPGVYTIELQASMFPDVWPGQPYSWTIHVNQPWWQATGGYIIIAMLLLITLIINSLLYTKNAHLHSKRDAESGDIMRKILGFIKRCDSFDQVVLSPFNGEKLVTADESGGSSLSPEFVSVMLKAMPYLRQVKKYDFSMRKLCQTAGVEIGEFYDIISTNIYKNPDELVRIVRLQKAADLLKSTDKSIEDITDECLFYSPNYFIGSFFHQYGLTPREYREEHAI